MVTLHLSDHEARILARLLERAGDEFSNHGCNDFHVGEELGLGAETDRVASELRQAMVTSKVGDPEMAQESGPYLLDWLLFRLFQKRVEGAPKNTPQVGGLSEGDPT